MGPLIRNPPAFRRVIAVALLAGLLPRAPLGGEVRPAWVEKFPHDPGQYIGIGRGDKKNHPREYREMAQSAALAQISREISIRLETESSSRQAEDAGGWREAYSQNIAGSSRNELSGYRLADVYETEGEYWVCYSLDKEKFRQSLEERARRLADWLGREQAALHSELQARRIQKAMDRFSRIRKAYEASHSGDPLSRPSSSAIPARYGEISEKMRTLAREMRLATAPANWTLDFRNGPAVKNPVRAEVHLVGGSTREKWQGPLSLSITNRNFPESAPCRVETGAEGELDLAHAFLDCGLKPGLWRVTWSGPENHLVAMDVRAELIKMEIGLAVRGMGAAGGDLPARLDHELTGLDSPYYHIVSGLAVPPSLEIHLREVAVDSLDGMYFTTIRGDARFPGMPAATEVSGKSGHVDKDRSRARAIRDFAGAIGKMAD
jgi:hypothetical protein